MSLITITQNYGAEGQEVARQVAETLGWKLFDDHRLQELIQQRGIAPEEVKKLDEKAPGYWDLFFKSRPHVFLNVLESVIYEVAQAGDGVIIGHGSQVLLRSFDCAFHVRLLASEKRRIDELSARRGMSREAALRLIRKRDHEQAGFFKFAFQIDMDDPAEVGFLTQMKVNLASTEPVTLVVNAQGQMTGTYSGAMDVASLVQAATKKAGGCCPKTVQNPNASCAPPKK